MGKDEGAAGRVTHAAPIHLPVDVSYDANIHMGPVNQRDLTLLQHAAGCSPGTSQRCTAGRGAGHRGL